MTTPRVRTRGRHARGQGGARWPRWRADLRLAWRQVRRTPSGSLLVATLVALPATVLGGAATLWASEQPSVAQQVTLELGQAQSWVSGAGWGAGTGYEQYVDAPNAVVPSSVTEDVAWSAATETDAADVIPAGATVLPVAEYASTVVETAAGLGRVTVTVGQVWDPVLAGRYVAIGGDAPTGPGEAMATPGLLERLGARIGDQVVLHDGGQRFTITGTLRRADQSPDDQTLFLPASALDTVGAAWTSWFVADWQPDMAELRQLNAEGYVAYARDLVLDPPADAPLYAHDQSTSAFWSMLLTAAVAVVFGGYLTVLLSGAALSVNARRQQRTLAVAASVGASRGDVFRIVLLQGSVLGLVGGMAGSAVGVGAVVAFLAATDHGVVGSVLEGNWGLRVPWALLAAVVAFSVIAGTVSAIAPARAASRGDTIGALRGARRPGKVHARRPLWGVVLMLAGIAAGVAGGVVIATTPVTEADGSAAPLRVAGLCAIVVGPVLLQVGVILAGHWLLALIARGLSRLGLAARLASRDAAANPSRVVPAFAAIAACVFLASFALCATAVSAAAYTRTYTSQIPVGSVGVGIWGQDADALTALVPQAQALLRDTRPAAAALVLQPSYPDYDTTTGAVEDPDFPVFTAARATAVEGCSGATCGGSFLQADGSIMIVAADDAGTALGTGLDESQQQLLRDGGALVTDDDYLFDGDQAAIARWRTADLTALYDEATFGQSSPVTTTRLPAAIIDLPVRSMYRVVITPATAEALGIHPVPMTIVASYDQLPAQDVLDRLQSDADVASSTDSGLYVQIERGPTPVDPWMWLMVAATGVLVVCASAVCLGLARFERRPDDATLAAIGGRRGLRRRINAWQAVVIVGIGSVSGAVVGALPMYGIAMGSSGGLDGADTPWPWLVGLALALPLAIAAVSWLIAPRTPDLTHRTVIA